MAEVVAAEVRELIRAFGDAVVDGQLVTRLGDKARSRSIVGGSAAHMLEATELVGSKVLEVLYANKKSLKTSSGNSHVFYAPSSSGKTAALMYFMKNYLEVYKAPAIMISGHFPGELDYLTCMAAALQVPTKAPWDVSWVNSLITSLMPKAGETFQHAPVLILDEFNSAVVHRQNILFAESFARFVYGKKMSVLFVTQNEELAREICKCNAWQKIGPFPGLTTPDRMSEPLPPQDYEWKDLKWSNLNLTQMIQRRQKYKGKFSVEGELDADGNFIWLKGITNATTALLIADSRLADIIPEKEGAVTFEDGFFNH